MSDVKRKKKIRWRYLIDKKFQGAFIARFSTLIVLGMLLVFGILLYLDAKRYSKGLFIYPELIEKEVYYVNEGIKKLDSTLDALEQTKESMVEDSQKDAFDKEIEPAIDTVRKSMEEISDQISSARKGLAELRDMSKEVRKEFNKLITVISEKAKDNKWIPSVEIQSNLNELTIAVRTKDFEKAKQISLVLANSPLPEEVKTQVEVIKNLCIQIDAQVQQLKAQADSMAKSIDKLYGRVGNLVAKSQNYINTVKPPLPSSIEASVESLSSSTFESINLMKKGIQVFKQSIEDKSVFRGQMYKSDRYYNLFQLYWRVVVGVSVLYIVLTAVFGLFYSHKMAGPVYRIKRTLREMADGQMPLDHEIRLRKGDQFQDLAEVLNYFLRSVNDRLKNCK